MKFGELETQVNELITNARLYPGDMKLYESVLKVRQQYGEWATKKSYESTIKYLYEKYILRKEDYKV